MRVIILLTIGLILCSCCGETLKIPAHPAILGIAPPVWLESDTMKIQISHYFTYPEKIEKITPSRHLQIRMAENGQELLVFAAGAELIENIAFLYDGYTYDIPVLKRDVPASSDSSLAIPVLFTNMLRGDTVFLKSNGFVTDMSVYVRNYKLYDKSVFQLNGAVAIVLPKEIKHLDHAELRVWAGNRAGLSNEMRIPLKQGEVVTDIHFLESLRDYDSGGCRRIDTLLARCSVEKIDGVKKFCQKNIAMMLGDCIPLRIKDGVDAYLFSYFKKDVIIAFNNGKEPLILKLELPDTERHIDFKSLFGGRFSYDNSSVILDIPAESVELIHN